MKRIELKITALSPLAISRQKPGSSVSEVETYIPGSVIRGAIAGQMLEQYGQKNANLAADGNHFQSLFLNENSAIFQNAYPAIAKIYKDKKNEDEEDEFELVTDEVRVLPATAVSSKADSGFKPKANGVFDTLIDRFCAEAYNYPFDPSDPKSLEDKTDARVEPYGGFYSKTDDSQVKYKYRSHSVSTRFLTRVGINRRRATSEDDILYSIEVLNESFVKNPKSKLLKIWDNFVYRSLILVEDEEIAKLLQRFIDNNSDRFRLGGSASRGLGKVKIEAKDGKIPETIESRIKEFNARLKNRWELWPVFSKPRENLLEGRTYFTIDLQSDAILTEKWRRTTVISPDMLCQLAGLEEEFSKLDSEEKDNFLKLHVAYSSYDYRSGWNSAWGLMKDMELITNKGSVYLFSTNKPDIWFDKLGRLEEKGAGERTCEGFGQIQICNEFHLIFRENAV